MKHLSYQNEAAWCNTIRQSVRRSAETLNGGKGISGSTDFFILKNLFNTKNLAILIIWFIFAQKQEKYGNR